MSKANFCGKLIVVLMVLKTKFVLVIHHFYYSIRLWGKLDLNVSVLQLEYKNLFLVAFIGQEQTIRRNNLNVKKITGAKF